MTRQQNRNSSISWIKAILPESRSVAEILFIRAIGWRVTGLAKEIREKYPEKTIWLYTGSLWETVKGYEVMKYVDVLVDGEYECDKRDTQLHWKGSSNQRVIDVQDSLRRGQVVLHNS